MTVLQRRAWRQMVFRCSGHVLLILLAAGAAAAQNVPADPAAPSFRLGPLAFSPSIALNDIGVDFNVFNDPANPKRDFTATVMPRVDFRLPLGPSLLSGKAGISYVYFHEFASERAFNTDNALKLEFPLARVRPYALATYLNAMDRHGYEIDARVRHEDWGGTVGLDVPVGSILTVGLSGARNHIHYDDNAIYNDVPLSETLTRDLDTVMASADIRIAPLTTVVVEAEAAWESFPAAPDRNAESVRLMAGVAFKPSALLEGRALVGRRDFDIADPRVPDYSGLVARINVGYPITEGTRVDVLGQRDITYSYTVEEPYYVFSSVTGSVRQQVYGPVSIRGRVGWEELGYVAAAGNAVPSAPHTDNATQYGGSIEFSRSESSRLAFHVDQYRRRSTVADRNYDTLRVGMSVVIGF